jgi:hypothetical protein
MLTAFISAQTVCVLISTGLLIKNIRPKKAKLKVSSNVNGFKHFKTF